MNLISTLRREPTPEEAEKTAALLHAGRPVTVSTIAQAIGATDLQAAALLPPSIAAFVEGDPAERFPEVWEALCEWEKALLFIIHEGSVFEIEGRLSPGKIGMGYYNVMGRDAAIGGHFNYQGLGGIAFLEIPFMKRTSLSVQFFTREGAAAFAIFAGRANREIVPSVREAFYAAKARFCAPAA